MESTPGQQPAHATLPEVIEQVMRISSNDVDVLTFLAATPGTPRAAASLGRFLRHTPATLAPGCPLLSFTTATPLDPHWRSAYPPRSGSLYETLTLCRSLDESPATDEYLDLYEELTHYQR